MSKAFLDMLPGIHLPAIHLSGGTFFRGDFTDPWCVSVELHRKPCSPNMPEPSHIIAYLYVTEGEISLKVEGQRPVLAKSGEILILPRNDPHILGSDLNLRPVCSDDLLRPTKGGFQPKLIHGGGGEKSSALFLCGFMQTQTAENPLLSLLPPVLKLNTTKDASKSWIESCFNFAMNEVEQYPDRSSIVLARLAELLVLEGVRRHMASHQPNRSDILSGLHDPLLARALTLLHRQISRNWTTDELAREVGLSRSAFAERFTKALNFPPMRYLTQQRLKLAATRLQETLDPIAQIAHDIGYESEAAFNRAFKRTYGDPPAAWRLRSQHHNTELQ